MRSYSSFLIENRIKKEFSKKKVNPTNNLKKAVETQAEIDAARDAAKDIKKSGKLGNVTSDVKKELSKTLKQTPGDPKGSTMIKGTPDEKIIRDTKPTGDEGKFRRPAKRYRGRTFADVKADIDAKEAPKIKKSIVPPKDGGKQGVENILKDIDKKYTPPSKTQSQNIQTNSVKNTAKKIADQGKKNKVINLNAPKGVGAPSVNKGSGTGSKASVDLPKFTHTDNPAFKTSKVTTGNTINYVEKPRVEIKNPPGMVDKRSYKGPAKNLDVDLPDFVKKTRKPRTIAKSYITQPKSPIDIGGTIKRGAELTGLKSIEPKQQVGSKLKNIPQSKITKTIIKKTPKKLVFNRALSGLGRVAGGAFAVKDFMDTARKEKALGRSKTAARLRGASKALGGYIGGGIGALAGGLAGGGIASAGLGIGGGIAGYSAGSKIGDQIYKTGRKLVTGKKTFKDLRKDINKGAKNVYKGTKNFFDTSGNP